MSSGQRNGLAAIVALAVVAFGVWTFWGAQAVANGRQNTVLGELHDVVASDPVEGSTETSTEPDLAPAATDSMAEATTTATAPATLTEDSTTEAPTTVAPATVAPAPTTEAPTTPDQSPDPEPIPTVATFEVIETIPHDTAAFTQGLEILDGRIYESTGLVGRSSIRELDLATGEILRNVAVPDVFAEGLTIVGDTAIQLTWQDEVAFVYDLKSFEIVNTFSYSGEGWGLCLATGGDGNLVMSDGTSELEFRDPESFESLGTVDVQLDGSPVANINELECVGSTVWANIWQSSLIIEIDPSTGNVITVLDIDSLRPESTEGNSGAVWNGLAYDPGDGTLLVTGKLWPELFRLELS